MAAPSHRTRCSLLPQELRDAVAGSGRGRVPSATNGFLNAVVSGTFGRTAEPVVREIFGRQGRDRQVQRMVDALDSDQVAQVNGGAWLVMPDPMLVDASLIACALETTLADSHPGWKLVHTVKSVLRHGGSGFRDDAESLVKLARALCAPVPLERQIEMLTRLAATRPAKDSPGGRMFRRLLACFVETGDFSRMSCQRSTYRPKMAIGARAETSREPKLASRVGIS